MSTYRYDIEDWKMGHIPRPKKIEDDPRKSSLVYWTYVNDPPRIKESEFRKIRSLQKETYFDIIELKADHIKSKFLYDLEHSNSNNEKELFELEIEGAKNNLKDPNLLKKVKLGKWDRTYVKPRVYNIYVRYKKFIQENRDKPDELYKHENIYGDSFMCGPYFEPITSQFLSLDATKLLNAHISFRYLDSLSEYFHSNYNEIIERSKTIEFKPSDDIHLERFKEILITADSITAGKIKLVQYVRDKFDLRTEKLAFKKASELYSELHDGHKKLYKDLGSYHSAKSQYFKEKLSN